VLAAMFPGHIQPGASRFSFAPSLDFLRFGPIRTVSVCLTRYLPTVSALGAASDCGAEPAGCLGLTREPRDALERLGLVLTGERARVTGPRVPSRTKLSVPRGPVRRAVIRAVARPLASERGGSTGRNDVRTHETCAQPVGLAAPVRARGSGPTWFSCETRAVFYPPTFPMNEGEVPSAKRDACIGQAPGLGAAATYARGPCHSSKKSSCQKKVPTGDTRCADGADMHSSRCARRGVLQIAKRQRRRASTAEASCAGGFRDRLRTRGILDGRLNIAVEGNLSYPPPGSSGSRSRGERNCSPVSVIVSTNPDREMTAWCHGRCLCSRKGLA
jgi:hypothetical protein